MLLGGAMTLAALWAAGWRRPQQGPAAAVFFGVLVVDMLLLCPVCHLHYFCMAVPLVMGLLAARLERLKEARVGLAMAFLLGLNVLANIPGQIPGFDLCRDCGLAMYSELLLWGVGIVYLWKQSRAMPTGLVRQHQGLQAAA